MRLLFKYPSRGRPLLFVKTLQRYLYLMSGKHDCDFLIAMDTDDETMNTVLMRQMIKQLDDSYPRSRVMFYYKAHDNIVEVVNEHLDEQDFDIVMAIGDDFLPQEANYDEIIVNAMKESWPKLDGAIYFNDGVVGEKFALAPILGRELYKERGYFFDPVFRFGEADREISIVLRIQNKLQYYPEVLFVHDLQHHHQDDIYTRTRKMRIDDQRTFKVRKMAGYYDELKASIAV